MYRSRSSHTNASLSLLGSLCSSLPTAKKVIRDEINKTLERSISVHQLAPDFYKKKNYYSRLGLPKDSSLNDVKKQYREIAKVWHPDKKGGDEEVFRRVKEAYEGINELLIGD